MVRSHSFRKNITFLKLDFSKPWYCTAVLWKKNAVWWLPEVSAAVLSYIRHETIFPLTHSSTTTSEDLWVSPGSHMRKKEMYTVFSSSYSFQEKHSQVKDLVLNITHAKYSHCSHWKCWLLNTGFTTLWKKLASITVIPTLPWNDWLSSILK